MLVLALALWYILIMIQVILSMSLFAISLCFLDQESHFHCVCLVCEGYLGSSA